MAIRRRQTFAAVIQTFGQTVDPQPAVGVEHDLGDSRVLVIHGANLGLLSRSAMVASILAIISEEPTGL
jgi:hypothetical protein